MSASRAAIWVARAKLSASGVEANAFEGVGAIPPLNPDRSDEPGEAVLAFRTAIRVADAVLMAAPEYAGALAGVVKNALDWIVSSGELSSKPVALLMASPSGAEHAWAALTPTLRVMEADLVFEASLVLARRHFAGGGLLSDAGIEAEVRRALEALAAAVAKRAPSR